MRSCSEQIIFDIVIYIDSCDIKINEEGSKMTQYLKQDMLRPCFNIEIYFQKLQQLQQMDSHFHGVSGD